MTNPTNDRTPIIFGAAGMNDAEARTFRDGMTDLERLLVAAAAVKAIFDGVIRDSKNGRVSVAGIWIPKESGIITVAQPGEIELIGIKVPLEFAADLCEAYNRVRKTPEGVALGQKITAYIESRAQQQQEGPQQDAT